MFIEVKTGTARLTGPQKAVYPYIKTGIEVRGKTGKEMLEFLKSKGYDVAGLRTGAAPPSEAIWRFEAATTQQAAGGLVHHVGAGVGIPSPDWSTY